MSKLVKVIVEEREQRLKELMLMMGLHPGLSRLRAGGGGLAAGFHTTALLIPVVWRESQ